MKRLLAAFFLLGFILAGAGSAMAQDDDNFKGFYVGGMVGETWSRGDYATTTVFDPAGYFAASSTPAIATTGAMELKSRGFSAVFDTGYNWRMGHMLVGIEGDIGALYLRDYNQDSAVYPCCAPTQFFVRQDVSTNWMFTGRPRIGYTSGGWLVYGTGGVAVANVASRAEFNDTFASARETARGNENKLGWVAGAGLEFKLASHWAVKGEYLYVNLGDISYTSNNLVAFTPPIAFPGNVFTHSLDLHTHVVRGGFSYYFGGK